MTAKGWDGGEGGVGERLEGFKIKERTQLHSSGQFRLSFSGCGDISGTSVNFSQKVRETRLQSAGVQCVPGWGDHGVQAWKVSMLGESAEAICY